VLRRGADQGGTADVDVFDNLFVGTSRSGRSRFERIEVANDQVNGCDSLFLQGGHVLGIIAHREHAAVNERVQGLDPAVEDLGKPSDFRDVHHGQLGSLKCLAGAAGGNENNAKAG